MAVSTKVYTPRTTESKQVVEISELGAAAQNPSTTGLKIGWIRPDNLLNSAVTFLKGYDNAAPTVGTTQPDIVLPVPGNAGGFGKGSIRVFPSMIGLAALSWAAVTAQGTAGTTAPTSAFNVDYGVDA
jgi:hypothetical protein